MVNNARVDLAAAALGMAGGVGVSTATGIPLPIAVPVGAALGLGSIYIPPLRENAATGIVTALGIGGLATFIPAPVPDFVKLAVGAAVGWFSLTFTMQPIYGDGAGYVLDNPDLLKVVWSPLAVDSGNLEAYGQWHWKNYGKTDTPRPATFWFTV